MNNYHVLRIVADHKIPFLRGALEKFARVEYLPGRHIGKQQLQNADVLIIRTRTLCNELLLGGSAVQLIATATIGHDHIDKEYCQKQGIRWINAPGCNAGSVQQYIASCLAHILEQQQANFGELRLGIIGAGHIGSRVQAMAGILGIRCLVNDPPRQRAEGPGQFVPLEQLLETCDIVTMHVPLYMEGPDRTFQMADAGFFARMKKGAWFINTSRGEVHQSKDLLQALQSEHLGGAILDVWENEPEIDRQLLQQVNIATPHIAGYSLDGKANGTATCVQAVSRFFRLGIDNWRPERIPPPPDPLITIPDSTDSSEALFRRLALGSYNIMDDSRRLKQSPPDFESLREEYPIRREPHAFDVKLEKQSPAYRKMVQQLGFQLVD